jgi:hypothetical protein
MPGFQSPEMMRANFGKHLVSGNGAPRIGLHRVVDWRDLLAKPSLDRNVTLLERPKPCPNHLAG